MLRFLEGAFGWDRRSEGRAGARGYALIPGFGGGGGIVGLNKGRCRTEDNWILLWLFLAGGGLGFINAMAGGGSVLTIPILTEAVGAAVANGTNRIAILAANLSGTYAFHRSGKVPWRSLVRYLPAALAGAVLGSWLSTLVPAAGLRGVFAVVMVSVAAAAIIRPQRWMREGAPRLSPFWMGTVVFLIGVHGGFIQIGAAILLLVVLVWGGGMDLVKANAAKVAIVGAYTVPTLAVFMLAGQVDLRLGAAMAVGNIIGAYAGALMAVTKGEKLLRWFFVVAALGAAARMAFF